MAAEMATTDEETEDTDAESSDDVRTDAHLAEIEDGAGCAEIWEHLSRERAGDDD